MRGIRAALLCLASSVALVATACQTPPTGTGNLTPVAVITATPESGAAPLEVEFSSAGSSDPDGSITAYEWDFGDGSPVETTENATHTYAASGDYTASLKVTDNGGKSKTVTVLIEVSSVNQSPTAVIASDVSTGKAPLTVNFDGTGSSDPEGTALTYAWDFGGGATSSDPAPVHVFTDAGPHVVTLTVTDAEGAEATDTTTIDVVPNVAPIAAADASPTAGKVPLAVVFSSAGSEDPDGSIASYSWDFGDGTALSSDANPSHTYTTAGLKTATLTVTDDSGDTDSTTVDVQVNANVAPTAVANSNVSAGQAPLTVTFSSAGSSDPDGGITTYAWAFGDGNTSALPNPTYTYSTPGEYTAVLTVGDAEGATDSASIAIQVDAVPNELPTAMASATPTTQRVGLAISFSSAGSGDTDGTIVGYDWDFGDGGDSTQANPSHAFATPGTKTVTLTVTDNAGGTATTTVEVEITPNAAPTAVASGNPTTGTEPLLVNFSSAGSGDTDGTISYAWDFGDGGTSTQANPTHTYTTAGSKTATLTVTDDFGATDSATVNIEVLVNQVPVAAINATPQSGPRPLNVSFDGTASSDPEGTALSYAWDFGDGGNGTGATPSHTYAAGSYTASLTVTDAGGKVSAPVTIGITVYIDDDGDGVQPPTDCNDNSASTYPGAPDPLDDAAADTNCDGYDGVLAQTVFVKASGGVDSGSCGTVAAPCATIGQGVTNAAGSGKSVVQVTAGSYGGFTLTGAITVRGGYNPTFTGRAGATTVTGSGTGVLASATAPGATLADLTINSGTPAGAGASAYGVRATGSTLTIRDAIVSAADANAASGPAGSGGSGSGGCNGATGVGAPNWDPPSNDRTPGCGGAGVASSGYGGQGGQGAFFSCAGRHGESGGNGGGGALGGAYGGCGGTGSTPGGGGAGGAAGGAGAPGTAGSNNPNGSGATYSVAVAGGGATGGTGGGAGGGAGGGGTATNVWGGAGGAGGAGGTGGTGGAGGTGGGGSFAVYSHNSNVTVVDTQLSAGRGGAGGAGGIGGTGGKGGNGGNGGGANTALQGAAGSGGGGGAGGAGGSGGGGGAGGPSISAFHIGSGTLSVTSTTSSWTGSGGANTGSGAAGGSGGPGGAGGGSGSAGGGGDGFGTSRDGNPGGTGPGGNSGNTGVAGATGLVLRVWSNGVTTP